MEIIMEQRLLTVKQLSAYLSTPKGCIYVMVHMHKIPPECIVKLGKSLRFEKAGIDKWITGNRASS